jgi:hypothetical protein
MASSIISLVESIYLAGVPIAYLLIMQKAHFNRVLTKQERNRAAMLWALLWPYALYRYFTE